eukprot:s2714_g11.t1
MPKQRSANAKKWKTKTQKVAASRGKKLGKSACLPGPLMAEWLSYLLVVGPTWLHVLVKISYLLCLRVSEACRLQAADFDWRRHVVRVAALKRQPEVLKPLLPECLSELARLKRKGVSRKRSQLKGSRGSITWKDHWQWPGTNNDGEGWLFPSLRVDSKTPHICKDTVCKAIARVRNGFLPKRGILLKPTSSLRSHSSRQTMINTLKASLISDEAGMLFARIKSKAVYQTYGELEATQAARILKGNKRLRTSLANTIKHK